ncbi:MAG: hypothetical protein U0U09_18645 [Cyclobacteriaceae bacterium]
MKNLINLKEKHYLVSYDGKTYAVNGVKFPWEKLSEEIEIQLHPISKVGIINYNELLKVNGAKVTAEGHHLGSTQLGDLAKRL